MYTVLPLLEATASNYVDEFFAQNLLSKNCILVRLLFEGGFYSRAASNNGNTVGQFKSNISQYKDFTLENVKISKNSRFKRVKWSKIKMAVLSASKFPKLIRFYFAMT